MQKFSQLEGIYLDESFSKLQMPHPSWSKYPQLSRELDLSKNKGLTWYKKPVNPFELSAGTHAKLDWICNECDHEWKSSGSNRIRGNGCPACANLAIHIDGRNSMAKTHKELAQELQGDPNNTIAGTNRKLHWECKICSHRWKAAGSSRVAGAGCPACSGRSVHIDGRNSMKSTHPKLAEEYMGDANLVVAGTHKKLKWKCSACNHIWQAVGTSRIAGRGCPACSNYVLHTDGKNSMAITHPKLAIEYQGDPTSIVAGTALKLDWKCSACNHIWQAVGASRVSGGHGCPYCAGQVLHVDGRNSMAITHPDLAKEYLGDATKVMAGTNKKLDWKCSACNLEWKAQGSDRAGGTGCPSCSITGYDTSRIGYLYIHHYSDGGKDWLKCGITNDPFVRVSRLKAGATKFNIEIAELDVYKFDDGAIPQNCEKELLAMTEIRYDAGYDIDGKTEFFKYEALETIRKFIEKW